MSNVIYAPHPHETEDVSVFLAGSIEQGKAEKWQDKITTIFQEVPHITFLNPRRPDWDSTWGEDNPKLIEQIQWELRCLRYADIKVFYFDPTTKSPVTLLEMGRELEHNPSNCIICCPKGYWRRTNVTVTCDLYDVPVFDTFDEMVSALAAKMLFAVERDEA